jgi:predicted MPP superfamily phosphohydrolase
VRTLPASLIATTAVGMAGLGYAVGIERRAYTLRRVEVPVLPTGSSPLRVLHMSDLHLTPAQSDKQRWVRGLAALQPDLVVNTGDNLAHQDAVPVVMDAFGGLLDIPGVFVFGSNDYFAPVLKNPVRYLLPRGKQETPDVQLPHKRLRAELTGRGWLDLSNRRDALEVADSASTSPAWTTRTSSTTTSRRLPGQLTPPPRSRSASPMRRTCGSSTASTPTATSCSSPATPMADSCASPASAPS